MLSSIERQIKEKIEQIGIPLKDWDIQINYGVKTGFNEAFIIPGWKRRDLIEKDPRSEEIIRPILRGRDIKRFGYTFADRWLINTHNGLRENGILPINIEEYPAIKTHLNQYWKQIEARADQGVTPYNLRNCAYIEDFFQQKLVWAETMRIHKNSADRFPRFGFDLSGNFVTDKTCFFAVGRDIKYVLAVLNSTLGRYLCSKFVSILDDGGYLMQKIYLENIPIAPKKSRLEGLVDTVLVREFEKEAIEDELDDLVYQAYGLSADEISFVKESLTQ